MELIGTIVLAILAILGAALSKQLTDEFKSWTPWITNRLILRSISKLPEEYRERLEEEWRGDVEETPGEIGKLYKAAGFLIASRKIVPTREGEKILPPEQETSFSSSGFLPDRSNPGCIKGWGVVRLQESWHLVGLFPSKADADRKMQSLGEGYGVRYGSHRMGTDDFI
jgi:hypothetical protein